jgi:Asp-tRNA(Asn)/Glu-tRNA(Gln) amidotransferase A subunit family amidase
VLDGLGCEVESSFIWGPRGECLFGGVESAKARRVWWCWGGKFTPREDIQAAMEEAEKRNAEAGMDVESFPVARFEFSIEVGDDLRSALVYIGWQRGPLWGQGNRYTLQRSASGEWWVVESEQLWIS